MKTCPVLFQVKEFLYMEDSILNLEIVLYKHLSPPKEGEERLYHLSQTPEWLDWLRFNFLTA